MPLKYTPRKIRIHPYSSYLVINELEVNCLGTEDRTKMKVLLQEEAKDINLNELDERKLGYFNAK